MQKKFTFLQRKFTFSRKKVYIFDKKVYIIYQKLAKKFTLCFQMQTIVNQVKLEKNLHFFAPR